MKGKHIIKTYAKILVVIAVIIAIAWGVMNYLKQEYQIETFKTIKTNMLLIEAQVQVISEKVEMKEKGARYIGKPIIDMAENEQIQNLIQKKVINPNEKKCKYYVLEKEDLEVLNLHEIELQDSYYIVDYKTNEVIYTKGIINPKGNILYKLSEIEK